jgi:hypothetical protein
MWGIGGDVVVLEEVGVDLEEAEVFVDSWEEERVGRGWVFWGVVV